MKARALNKKRRQLADSNDIIQEKVQQLMEITGQAGLAIKVCLLAGLTASEAAYCYNQEICENSGCCNSCHKLHVISKRNGMTIVVIRWTREHGRRCYFALLPTILWDRFRELIAFNEADIKAASESTQEAARIELSRVYKIFYSVMRKTMDSGQIDILVGNVKPSIARSNLIFGLETIIESYVEGWLRVGVVLPVI